MSPMEVTPVFPTHMDSTMLACLGQCEQKFFNEFVLQIAPRAVSPDLHAGGAFAAGLETARREYYVHGRRPQQCIHTIFLTFAKFWGLYDPVDHQGKPHVKDFVNMFCALLDYFREYPFETDNLKPLILANSKPAVEFTFALPLEIAHPVTDEPVLLSGRCDMVGYYEGVLRIIDEKTGKSLADAAKWNMRGQFICYLWAARMYGFDVSGALVRNIAILKTEYKHLNAPIEYPNHVIEQWYESIHVRLARAIERWKQMVHRKEEWHKPWQKEFGEACEAYGMCQYMGLCRAKYPWEWYSDFERRVWNPLDKDPTGANVSKFEGLEDVYLPEEVRRG